MANLFSATRTLARFLGITMSGDATGGSTSTLVDSSQTFPQGEYLGGTIWIDSGTYAGQMRRITAQMEGTLTFSSVLAGAVVSGVRYTIATPAVPLSMLKQAVNSVLEHYPIQAVDTTLVFDADVREQTLPTGVTHVLRVEVAEDDPPTIYTPLHYWEEREGKLIIAGGLFTSDDDAHMRLTYRKAHGELDETGTIDTDVNLEYLKFASAVFAWRNMIQTTHRDNSIAMDMMNEAKMLEAQRFVAAFQQQFLRINRDTRLAAY